MEERRLSSLTTFFTKFLAPVVLFVWLGLIFFYPRSVGVDDGVMFKLTVVFMFVYSFIYADIKYVRTDGKKFVISNYLKKVSVPCSSLRAISSRMYAKSIIITLTFEPETPFGPDVSFLSPLDFKNVYSMLENYISRDI